MTKLTESDFNDGWPVSYANFDLTRKYTGMVDCSYGEEKEGYVRVRRMNMESSDEGDVCYVPIGFIYGNN